MMLRPADRPSPDNPFLQIAAQVRAANTEIVEKVKPQVLTTVGIRLLSWAYQDYRTKSQGKEAQGITWRPITQGAIISRLAKRAPWKALQERRRALIGNRSDSAKKKRAQIWLKRNAMVAREWTGAKIGVDTGRLVNSFRYGDGSSGDTVFQVDPTANAVTIGATVKAKNGGDYAVFFDRLRPIFGPGFLGGGRAEALDKLVERAYEAALKLP